jgi:ferric-dicitrate binding protein FerR (iron transport regulator)
MSQERFKYLLERYKADELSASEEREWQEMASDESYRSIIESDISAFMAEPVEDSRWSPALEQETWRRILDARQGEMVTGARIVDLGTAARDGKVRRFYRSAAAAAACVLVVAGVWWLGVRRSSPSPSVVTATEYKSVTAPRGTKHRVGLPDGTLVWLNAGSTLRYPGTFAIQDRQVELDGEAYFEVTRNDALPFKVRAGELETEVLGTHFDIRAYSGAGVYRTALLDGKVRVIRGKDSLVLLPGQAAVHIAGANGLLLTTIKSEDVLAWKNNLFAFDRMPLPEIMQELVRWYDVRIQCGPGMDTLHMSGMISRASSLETTLKMLEFAGGLRYSIQGKTVQLELGRR